MATASDESQRQQRNHSSRRRAVHQDSKKGIEWSAIKSQEVEQTDADKDVQPHRKQAGADRG